ncbi:MAG TPA: EAL domain-containing protein [Gammaproteobacteria bacterium]|nr:EAL domain-containing protein [Gammaproteobacteria bacterium]
MAKFNSLKKHYIAMALLLGVVVLACLWGSRFYISRLSAESAVNIARRTAVTRQILLIKAALERVEGELDLYMLSPSPEGRRAHHAGISELTDLVDGLRRLEWVSRSGFSQELAQLPPLIDKLSQRSLELMELRLNGNEMYPAMSMANGFMLQTNKDIQTAFDLATRETREAGGTQNVETLVLLLEGRNAWDRLISAYRFYLINRMGSLYEEFLASQVNDVELEYQRFTGILAQLDARRKRDLTEFETTIAIETILRSAPVWYEGYRKVTEINTTDAWRSDIPLIKNVLWPLSTDIRNELARVDQALVDEAAHDVEAQAQASRTIGYVLWALGLIMMVVIALGFLLFNNRLLKPIAHLARALRDEAKGRHGVVLPVVQSTEMHYLIDAFTEMRKQVRSRQLALEHQAMHDALTNLPNRALLLDRLNRAILAANRTHCNLALLLLDLNRFKEINDTLGHQAGDLLLQQLAVRLDRCLRDTDTVARLGGDEFAILLPDIEPEMVEGVAAKVLDEVELVYEVDEHNLYISGSLGIALYPVHGDTAEELIRHADVAMYVSKRSNTSINFYDTEKDAHSISQLSILADLKKAVEGQGLEVYYQPQVVLPGEEVIGAEALLRWQHPERGWIPPDQFIPIAEQTGIIRKITIWVLNDVLRQIRAWLDVGLVIPVSVNLSVWDLQDAELENTLIAALEQWRVPAELLELEITESAMMIEPERAHALLLRLAGHGIAISIDDFGVGYSSLAYLKQLPVNKLKIDKSFVLDMINDDNDALIVRSTIELAHNLGIEVIAEGVENAETGELLSILQCDYLQGYHISRPVAVADFEKWLANRTLRAVPVASV